MLYVLIESHHLGDSSEFAQHIITPLLKKTIIEGSLGVFSYFIYHEYTQRTIIV